MSDASPHQWRRVAACWVRKQELPGLLALAVGLATLGLFCFAPWFSWQGIDIGAGIPGTPASDRFLAAAYGPHSYAGWATALGVPIPFTPSLFFGYLWLIPLIGLAFIFLAWLRLRRLLSSRVTLAALLALAGLTLLIEAGLWLQTRQFPEPLHFVYDIPSNHPFIAAGVSWGFWSVVGVHTAAIAAGLALLEHTARWLRLMLPTSILSMTCSV